MIKTLLWENSRPYTNHTNKQTLTLSETIKNFEYLEIVFKASLWSVSWETQGVQTKILISVNDLVNLQSNFSERVHVGLGGMQQNGLAYGGTLIYASDTSFQYTDVNNYNGGFRGTTNMVLSISGINGLKWED